MLTAEDQEIIRLIIRQELAEIFGAKPAAPVGPVSSFRQRCEESQRRFEAKSGMPVTVLRRSQK